MTEPLPHPSYPIVDESFFDFPDPLPVIISSAKCPIHGFHFVSYPRDKGAETHGLLQKCPLKDCGAGI